MKTPAIVFTLFIVVAAFIIANNKPAPPPTAKEIKIKAMSPEPGSPITTMQFDAVSKNLGKIKEGEILDINYEFTNTGKEMLIIKDVSVSCGCTVPTKPQEPIAPGAKGVINAKFDSRLRTGNNHKIITVFANTAQTAHELSFDVEVLASTK